MTMVYNQIYIFVLVMFFGFLLGFFFQIYYFHLRKNLCTLIKNIFDLFFGIGAGIAAFLFLLKINYASFRFYIVAAIFIGFYLYYKIFCQRRKKINE